MYKLNNLDILCSEPCSLNEKLFINSGVELVRPNQLNQYFEDAFIPRLDLQPIASFPGKWKHDIHKSIYVLKLPDTLIRLLENLQVHEVTGQEELFAFKAKRSKAFELFQAKWKHYLHSLSAQATPAVLHEIYIGQRKQLTSTTNYQRMPQLRTGMHIDTWNNLDLNNLDTAANRVCFNLGKGHRYFLFINLSLEEIIHSYLELGPEESNLSMFEIGKLFLERFPDYPLTFIKLEPYEGYIAPTENLIHDGSNFDSEEVDIQLTARGYFRPAGIQEKELLNHPNRR
jgi:hypothetical protein